MINKRWIVFIVGILAGLAIALVVLKLRPHGQIGAVPETALAKKKTLYQCSMHPSV